MAKNLAPMAWGSAGHRRCRDWRCVHHISIRVRRGDWSTQQDKIISLEPRRLSPADTAAIVAAVAPFSKEGVAFESYTGDGEAYALGAQLANAFHSTGMWVDPGNLLTVIPSKPVAWGVWLSGDDPRLVAAIMSALKAADIRAVKGEVSDEGSLMSSTPLFKPDVTVFIGMKPLPIAEP